MEFHGTPAACSVRQPIQDVIAWQSWRNTEYSWGQHTPVTMIESSIFFGRRSALFSLRNKVAIAPLRHAETHRKYGYHFYSLLVAASTSKPSRRQVLFLSPVWPERSSSAAGVRTSDLVQSFRNWGFDVAYSSPSRPNSHSQILENEGVQVFQCAPNREEDLGRILCKVQPSICIFDRFYAEEAFSFRVRQLAPNAVRVLDMQDVHFLRAGRQELVHSGATMDDVLGCRPTTDSAECLRELSAIHRSDLTLVCSPVELRLLVEHYGIPRSKLTLAPFFAPPSPYATKAFSYQPSKPNKHTASQGQAVCQTLEQELVSRQQASATHDSDAQQSEEQLKGYEAQKSSVVAQQHGQHAQHECPSFLQRSNFMMIGNFRHPPNMDSVEWTCKEVWPLIRQKLAASSGDSMWQQLPELHIYGSYRPGNAQRLHNPKEGVHLKGFAPRLDIMLSYRVSLAPLHFGAGLKGKVVDSWWHGLPVCTTPIGAEGMLGSDTRAGSSQTADPSIAHEEEDSTCSNSTGSIEQRFAGGKNQPQLSPDEIGFVWQVGGQQMSSSIDAGAFRPYPPQSSDPSTEGEPWQLGSNKWAEWGGVWRGQTAEEVAAAAVELYTQKRLWLACQDRGFRLLEELYEREANLEQIRDAVLNAMHELQPRRLVDFTGQLLWQQQFRATEFMSRWIELKEKDRQK